MLIRNETKSGFETRLGVINSLVTIGGYEGDKRYFRPDAHVLAHDGEVFINMRYPTLSTVDKPLAVNGRVEAVCDNKRFGYHTINNGELEFDVLFTSQPAPELVFELTHTDSITWTKQIITPEEWANGNRYDRPDAEGSWVAYMNKRDNRYQTGKVLQIRRAKLVDAKNNSSWCDINIHPDGRGRSILTVSMDEEWLGRATYPVLLDPVIGYNTKGSTAGAYSFGFTV
jgi:hypothetical protein